MLSSDICFDESMLEFVRVLKSRNHLLRTSADDFLPNGEVKSDAFSSFQSANGRISLYRLESQGPDLPRILAAYALTRQHLQHVDYVLLDHDFLIQFGASRDASSRGNTPDHGVNAVHEDLEVHTARKLFELVCALWQSRSIGRCETIDVIAAVEQGLQSSRIDRNRIKSDSMKESLRKSLRQGFN